jgi:hypothetical protein
VAAADVQAALRAAFARWGRPLRLRVDNGHPWAVTGGLPSALELWAAGVGVTLARNRPRCPQANGVVERSQGTAKRWADPGSCAGIDELRRRLAEEDRRQRQEYPALGGLSRLEAHPALLHSGRGYALAWERACWDLEAATRVLAGVTVSRKVSREGKVSLYDRAYVVGAAYRGEAVEVRLDAAAGAWVFGRGGAELRRQRAVELDRERIMALSISRQR